jgi:hypothetical protein
MKDKKSMRLFCVLCCFVFLCLLKSVSALSIGISPSKIDFENDGEFKEIVIFNPNKERVFIISKSENYKIVPKEFFVERENYRTVKIYAENCFDENATFFLKSNSNIFPAVKLSVECKHEERVVPLKTGKAKFENFQALEDDAQKSEKDFENNKSSNSVPDKKIGVLISSSIVISGLGIYFSMNKKRFRKIKGLLEGMLEKFLKDGLDF